MNKSILYTLLLILFSNVVLFSQQNIDKEIMVVEDYQPVIQDAEKISNLPVMDDTVKVIPSFNYSILPKVVKTDFEIRPIKPAKMVGVQEPLLYKSYLKLGAGNRLLPLAEFYINNLTSDDYLIGASLNHKNSDSKVTLANSEKVKAGFSDTDIDLYGKKFYRAGTLYGDINFTSNKVFYYGYNPDTILTEELDKKDIKQNYFSLKSTVGFSSLSTKTSDWNYDVKAHHLFFGDKYKYNENEIGLNAQVGKMFGSQYIKLNADIRHIIPNINLDTSSTTFVGIDPRYEKESDEWKVILGVNSYYIDDKDNAILYFFPVAQLNFNIYKDVILAYLGIKGDAKVNTYRELAMQNPYIQPGQYSPVSRTPLNIFAGFKANISKTISTNIYGAALSVKNMPFFINDTLGNLGNMFLVVNDDVDITKIYGEVNYDDGKKIRLQLKGNLYNYLTEKELEAWHKANFDVTLTASYNLQDKFLVSTEIFGVGERYAFNFDDVQNPIKLDPYIDVNVGIEYRYNHLLSIFMDFYNLSGTSYDIWNQYPTYKFGMVAGFTYSL